MFSRSRQITISFLVGGILFVGMVLTGSFVNQYFNPQRQLTFEVVVGGKGERNVYFYGDRVGTLKLLRPYYPDTFTLSLNAEEAIFGFLPPLPIVYRVYIDPMVLYKVNYLTQEISPFFGNDETGDYPGYITDISADEKFLVYLPYDRAEPRGRWEVVLHKIEDGKEKHFSIPEQYKEVGDAILSPDGKSIAYVAHLGEKEPERGGVFKINIETGDQEQIDWTDDGYFRNISWSTSGEIEYEHNRIPWEERR